MASSIAIAPAAGSAAAEAKSSGSIGVTNGGSVRKERKKTTSREENIRVAVRMRPLNSRELSSESSRGRVWKVDADENSILETTPGGEHEPGHAAFAYARAFGEGSSNREVYDGVVGTGIVPDVLRGYHGTVMTYGQTSSGKTFTMQGGGGGCCGSDCAEEDRGIVRMAAADIFARVERDAGREFAVRASYIEIYNEIVRDLLSPQGDDAALAVREDKRKRFFVKSREAVVTSAEDLLDVLAKGEKKRSVGATGMNERSSRSHTILRITVESTPKTTTETDNDRDGSSTSTSSTLNLVDLAGSESVRNTGATGERQKEGGKINKSLLALSSVITGLGENARLDGGRNQTHVNYRGSNLTKILQPSLSGNAKVAIICCATPSETYAEETRTTLQFADRAQLVKTNAKRSRRRLADGVAPGSRRRPSVVAKTPLGKVTKKVLSPARRLFSPKNRRRPQTDARPRTKRSLLPSSIPENEVDANMLERALSLKDAEITRLEAELGSVRKDLERERAEADWLRAENRDLKSDVAGLVADKEFLEEERHVEQERMDRVKVETKLSGEADGSVTGRLSPGREPSRPEGRTIADEAKIDELEASGARIGELEWQVRELQCRNEWLCCNAINGDGESIAGGSKAAKERDADKARMDGVANGGDSIFVDLTVASRNKDIGAAENMASEIRADEAQKSKGDSHQVASGIAKDEKLSNANTPGQDIGSVSVWNEPVERDNANKTHDENAICTLSSPVKTIGTRHGEDDGSQTARQRDADKARMDDIVSGRDLILGNLPAASRSDEVRATDNVVTEEGQDLFTKTTPSADEARKSNEASQHAASRIVQDVKVLDTDTPGRDINSASDQNEPIDMNDETHDENAMCTFSSPIKAIPPLGEEASHAGTQQGGDEKGPAMHENDENEAPEERTAEDEYSSPVKEAGHSADRPAPKKITPLSKATLHNIQSSGRKMLGRARRSRRATARYSPSGKAAPSDSAGSRRSTMSDSNAEFGAVGYAFRKNFGSWYGSYDGVVVEILPNGRRRCNYPADTSHLGEEILSLEELPGPKPPKWGRKESYVTEERAVPKEDRSTTDESDGACDYRAEVLMRAKDASKAVVAEMRKRGEETLWPKKRATCHICHYKRDVCLTFHCGKHTYCDKHCQKRLGFSASDYDPNEPGELPIDHCPVCALSCECSKCRRKLDSVASEMKRCCLEQSSRPEDVEMNLSELCKL